jgi:hypothetical protein
LMNLIMFAKAILMLYVQSTQLMRNLDGVSKTVVGLCRMA